VQAPTKYELIINVKTAKSLGLNVSQQFQQLADRSSTRCLMSASGPKQTS
jgi:hypothetical protein